MHGVSFFIPSLSACACLWVWSESPIAAYIWVLFLCQFIYYVFKCCYCYSVLKSCLFLWDPVDCSMQGFPFLHYHPEFVQTHVHWVNVDIQPSHPQLSCMPSVFPSIRVFSNESTLHFGHLLQIADSFEKTLMLERLRAGGEVGNRDEMVGWHHWLSGREFEQTPGDSEGQGSLECCSP